MGSRRVIYGMLIWIEAVEVGAINKKNVVGSGETLRRLSDHASPFQSNSSAEKHVIRSHSPMTAFAHFSPSKTSEAP